MIFFVMRLAKKYLYVKIKKHGVVLDSTAMDDSVVARRSWSKGSLKIRSKP